MKFLFEYRTRDNLRHDGEVCAANRDAAFAILKSRGIKPSRLIEAPGLFNLLLGRCKRWLAIGTLIVVVAILAVRYFLTLSTVSELQSPLDSMTRRQVIGDAAVIEKGVRTGWSDVFALEGERFLASFAIPGVPAGKRTTTEDEIDKALAHRPALPSTALGMEARQIVAMVEGMKNELRQFLADHGTVVEYGTELVKRQEQELRYYNMVKAELEAAANAGKDSVELEALWERRNTELRRMGIKLVPMPE